MGYLTILFTVTPILELAVIIKVGTYIGVGRTLFLLVLTGATGAVLARIQGFAVLRRINASLNEGRMPTDEMLDGTLILIGGILLLTPGFISDLFGFILLLPWTRALIKIGLRKKFRSIIAGAKIVPGDEPLRRKPPYQDFEDADFH